MTPLDPKAVLLHPAGHLAQEWQTRVPEGVTYGQLFEVDAWAPIEKLMQSRGGKNPRKGDLLRIIAADGSYDVTATIAEVGGGYTLKFRHGHQPEPIQQIILADLEALPALDAAEARSQAKAMRKRWQSLGASVEDIQSARRKFAQRHHPDHHAVDGRRLATANAVVDAALEAA